MSTSCAFVLSWVLLPSSSALDLFNRDLTKEPPRVTKDARFDLPLDISGQWQLERGSMVGNQWIWQECLEVTISGNSSMNGNPVPGSNAPLHHMIADGKYITYDDTQTTKTSAKGYFSYKAIIAAPTALEAADGATATLVFYEDPTMPGIAQIADATYNTSSYPHAVELAIRYIDSQGRLSFQQNGTHVPGSFPLLKMEKYRDLPCKYLWTSPESNYCATRTQVRPDQYNSFTPACCGDGYDGSSVVHESIANSKWAQYTADCTAEPKYQASTNSTTIKPTISGDTSMAFMASISTALLLCSCLHFLP